jgi:cyclophilin family peptidyl-prolyl cis-trans isomerase
VPTEKRQRQKDGRRARLEARRKVMRRQMLLRRTGIVVVVAAVVGGSVFLITGGGSSTPTTTTTTTSTTTTTTIPSNDAALQRQANAIAARAGCPEALPTEAYPANKLKFSKPQTVLAAGLTYDAKVVTTAGTFTFQLNTATAPINSNSFAFLAEHKFYKCVVFHRVIPGFMDQGGDPTGTGSGGPGYIVSKNEFPKAVTSGNQYRIGAVAMANSCPETTAPAQCPLTNGSQFFIVTGSEGEGLPAKYTVIGQLTSGLAVVEKINAQGNPVVNDGGVPPYVINRILSVTITAS